MSTDATASLVGLFQKASLDQNTSTGCYQTETQRPPLAANDLEPLKALAASGDAEANLLLGNRYRRGDGAPLDLFAAWNHYVTAARGGNLEAMTNIGVMYDQGQTVPTDPVKACRCYRYAAERGFAVAQYNLAIMYAEGLGTARNSELALHWFGAAAAQGYAPAAEAHNWLSAQQESL